MKNGNVKVIFDTNVWISFLIGKRLSFIRNQITNGDLKIIVTPQLLKEIKLVTTREKLKKYFPKNSVKELIDLLEIIALNIDIKPKHSICRDPKDNFLLDLIDYSKADFLVTDDSDLLAHNPFKSAQILTPNEFQKFIEKQQNR